MSPEAFRKSVLRGIAASPFAGSLTYCRGTSEYQLAGCLVDEKTNLQEVAEIGLPKEHVLTTHIPKTKLSFTPDPDKDRLKYQGRLYRFTLASGRQECSPVWVLEGRSPHS